MNNNDITPEECRIAARLLRREDFRIECGGYEAEAQWFERKAEQIEREEAEEKRIEELAQAFADTFGIESDVATWDHAADFLKNAYRAGIRAVLAHIDGGEREPRTWNDLRDVPADVKRIVGSNSSLVAYRDKSAEHGWMWDLRQHDPAPVSELGLTYSAPFMEAPDDV